MSSDDKKATEPSEELEEAVTQAEDTTSAEIANDNSDSDHDHDIFGHYTSNYAKKQPEEMSLTEYLSRCKDDKMAYANPAERLLDIIEEKGSERIDTSDEKGKLKNIYQGATIVRYNAFEDFYGMEDTIQRIVKHLKGAAEGDEYRKQVLYLLGPVGGGKSSLGDRVKELMQERPIYVLKSKKNGDMSPINETPLGLFDTPDMKQKVSEKYGIPMRHFNTILSPWAVKRLEEAGGDPNEAFEVVKVWPSMKNQIGVAKVEPQDENTQDVSTLVGKVNINELGEGLDQNDPDAYLYSGGFAHGNQGVMEFVEMFKTPLKVLNPMLEALQSRNYQGTESIGAIPFEGIVFAHSNESEWKKFSGNKDNEAILDRINVIRVPYTLQMDQEAKIYQKILSQGGYADAPIAPKTVDLLAKFSVMTRLQDVEGNAKYGHKIRAEVMNGETPEGPAAKVPTVGELKSNAPLEEGMSGISTRFAFKSLSETFNARANEGEYGADPILLFETLLTRIKEDGTISDDDKEKYRGFIINDLMKEYGAFVSEEISEAFTNASDDMCQAMFDRYIAMANAWIMDEPFNDKAVTGQVMSKQELDQKLQEIEKPSGIPDVKAFRDMVTRYVLNQQSKTDTKVRWDSYEKMREVIRANLSRKMQDAMPIIQFDGPALEGDQKDKRDTFLKNMEAKGYTMPMIKRAVGLHQKMNMG